MIKQLLFELKKIIRARTFFIFLILSILLIGGMFIQNVIHQDKIPVLKIEQFSKYLKDVSSELNTDREKLKTMDDPDLEAKIEVGVELYGKINGLIQYIRNNDWKEELEAEINVYNTAIQYKEMNGHFSMSNTDMLETIKLNKKLLAKELPKENMDLSIQTSIFMKKVVVTLLNTFGFLIILLVLGILITKEFEDSNMKLVYSLPISRNSYIGMKFNSLLISGIFWLVIVFLTSYLLPTLFGKNEGDIFTYPLYTDEGTFISTGDYLRESIFYSLSSMVFSIAALVLLGFLFRNTILTYLVILLLFIGSYIVITSGFTLFGNPFTYQSIDLVILKEPSYYPLGLVVPIAAAIILLVLTMTVNKRRGI